jgi:hypothetical protein
MSLTRRSSSGFVVAALLAASLPAAAAGAKADVENGKTIAMAQIIMRRFPLDVALA